MPKMQNDFLFEIGVEDVPARFMPEALFQLKEKSRYIFSENRLHYESAETYGTPRRLTLYITNLETYQEDLVHEFKGPPQAAAFDEEGNYTKAAFGFAKSCGVSPDELRVKAVNGGNYIFAETREKGSETLALLPDILQRIIKAISLPRTMRWGNGDMRFIRPIRWLVAVYGNEKISFSIAGVQSGRATYGHRFLSAGEVELTEPKDYFEALKGSYVVVDPFERKQVIWKQVEELAGGKGGRVEKDTDLLQEITFLLEYPTALLGKFNEKYLQLPYEVLETTMKGQQKYFPVLDKSGSLLPYFIALRDGTAEHIQVVAAGNEKVLEARLADAEFFYQEDTNTSLAEKVEKLEKVVYQENLGTLLDKTKRLQNLAEYIADELDVLPEKNKDLLRCAYLAKADLVTSMVYEFPELQGIMGSYYARHDGEKEEICIGIREHYSPRYSGDRVPTSKTGTIVAIADKIDNIIGCFIVGLSATGSQDPYGLRRQAQGISYIIKENDLNISLKALTLKSFEEYWEQVRITVSEEEILEKVKSFFKPRYSSIMEEDGIPYDIINSVIAAEWDRGSDVFKTAQDLLLLKKENKLEDLITAYNRVGNLAKKANTSSVDEELLIENAEKELWENFKVIKNEASSFLESKQYYSYFVVISKLRSFIDDFFDNVMVMVKEDNLRSNRLALIKSISDFMGAAADLSQVVEQHETKE